MGYTRYYTVTDTNKSFKPYFLETVNNRLFQKYVDIDLGDTVEIGQETAPV